jgi:large subunit ribosomal protein L29
MKTAEIKEMTPDERAQKVTELKETLFNLRFQHEIGQLENPQKIKQTKREIARIKTIIRESEINEKTEKE